MAESASVPMPVERINGGEHLAPTSAGKGNELYRLLVNCVKDYAIFVLDPSGVVLTWNEGARAIKGYAAEEIVGQHFSKFYLPEAVQNGWPMRELTMAETEGRFSDEGWRVKKDGTVFWASVIITALRTGDGHLAGFAKVTQDMTERKNWEERVQDLNKELRARVAQLDESQRLIELRTIELQKLSAQLLQAQDHERRRLARELHDELGQQLAGLKLVIDTGNQNGEASQLTDAALSTVRNLSYLLHPPLLDESGLRPALHWYVDGFTKRSKIQVALTVQPQLFPRLPKDIEVGIFRVIQESLTNVYRHSGSQSARIEIEKRAEVVIVRIRDYGKGIPVDVYGTRPVGGLGVGLAGMRERIRQFSGDLVVSRAEPGTLVEARIPILG